MRKKQISGFFLIAIGIILLVAVVWIIWGNTALEINEYTITSSRLPEDFSGFRIAQISDLHNAQFGSDNEQLLTMLQSSEPDIIVLTGDLVDSYHTDIEVSIRFAKQAVKIAPCYYVTGNHEARIREFDTLRAELETAGVVILENECITLQQKGSFITLIGVDDPSFQTGYLFGDSKSVMSNTLQNFSDGEVYTILLSHRPELFDVYVANNIDLVLSGHAHGGQFHLPFIGGILAPNQGLFPLYDSGLYIQNSTHMLVSRGIGNSIFPFRINNRPEIIVVELCPE